MIAVTVDDELLMLRMLTDAVAASGEIAEVHDFINGEDALDWMKTNVTDLAFLDINLRGIGGIELAKKIHAFRPECIIIFCTGYEEYALQAFGVQALGYLLKPVSEEAVQEQIDHVMELKGIKRMLNVQCFGEFEVFYQGKPVKFQRRKSKELLACLIAQKGKSITSREICVKLWEDDDNFEKHLVHLRKVFSDLNTDLKEIGLKNAIMKMGYSYAINTQIVSCDYYDYLKGKHTDRFRGVYMQQYSWAEEICGLLYRNWREDELYRDD